MIGQAGRHVVNHAKVVTRPATEHVTVPSPVREERRVLRIESRKQSVTCCHVQVRTQFEPGVC